MHLISSFLHARYATNAIQSVPRFERINKARICAFDRGFADSATTGYFACRTTARHFHCCVPIARSPKGSRLLSLDAKTIDDKGLNDKKLRQLSICSGFARFACPMTLSSLQQPVFSLWHFN
ncbi:MAG: hypothetical protein P1V13_10010 [Rhizobiaceae bacterium]|nr:hypothetical protein [Rhizobiaceae bacterium]|tara:strand:+ start:910 stop:1275 length:366 start_codon:yes stop_codon:yes gene_type:complete